MTDDPALVDLLPHGNALLNGINAVLLLGGRAAIRRGDRFLHRRLMLSAVAVGGLFVVSYVVTTLLRGHGHFPGDDWVRTLFVAILGTHTALAVLVVPLIGWTLSLALRERLAAHRRLAPVTFWVWLYVVVTGVVIYLLNNWVRPAV